MKWFALEVILEFITYIWYCVGANIFHFTTNLTIRPCIEVDPTPARPSDDNIVLTLSWVPGVLSPRPVEQPRWAGCAHNNVGHLLVHPPSSILHPLSSPSPLLTVTTHPPRPTHTNTLTMTLTLASEIFYCVTVPAVVQVRIKDFKFSFFNFILKQWAMISLIN